MSDLQLIFNGDDLGRTVAMNQAILRAHEEGVLTSASLMVTAAAAEDAVVRARACPRLGVGLHLALTDAPPASGNWAPHWLAADGRLRADPVRMGVACFFSGAVREALRRELAAQMALFKGTGFSPSHVDSHLLIHLHPTVLSLLIPLAEQHGFQGIRVPRDDLRLALAADRAFAGVKLAWKAIYTLLCALAEPGIRRSSLAYTDRVYGLLQSGRMHEAYVESLLRKIPPTVHSAELYFHPCPASFDGPFGPNPDDLATLLSPRVRQAIAGRGAQTCTYAAIRAGSWRRIACSGHSSS